MKQIPECFATTPTVYAVGRDYQIIVPVTKETLMWVEVAGKRFYDDVNGIIRSNCTTHKMTVPQELLDTAGEYTVCYRIVNERKPYYSDVSEAYEYYSVFYPVNKDGNVRFFHLADAHNNVEKPVAAAKAYGNIDFLILNGDLPDHSGDVKNFTTIHRIAAEITDGEKPVVFSRGNHDMRGIYAENLSEHTPTDNGRSYYTFRLGSIWGLVIDCGEDKYDYHIEYAHTICCEDFRKRELEYMKKIIENARREYDAEGVTKKIIVSHDPFTEYGPSQISEEDMKTYTEWAKLLRDYIKPDVMICGHVHQAYVTYVGDELDRLGQACPVVVSSAPGSKIYSPLRGTWVENVYVGVGFETGEKITVNFVGSDGAVHKDFEI